MKWILLRGLAREKRHYGAFVDAFADVPGADVVPMDLAGFGDESARASPSTVAGITDDLRARWRLLHGDAPAGIFALSLGGMVALDWAARYPRDLAHVVVVNTSAGDLSKPWERFAPSFWPTIPSLLKAPAIERERAIIDRTVNRPDVDRDALARTWATWAEERRPRKRSFVRQLVAATRSRAPARIDAPVLVLASRADRLVSWRCSERIAERLDAPLVLHDAAGHDLTLDDADWCVAKVRAWLATSEAIRERPARVGAR